MAFKVGDRVSTPSYGDGTIVKIRGFDLLVEHDDPGTTLHSGGGLSPDLRCWWYLPPHLQQLEDEVLQ